MKESEIYAVCGEHGPLGLEKVNVGGLLRSGLRQYRCKLCSRRDQKNHYDRYKVQLKKYHAARKNQIKNISK